MILFLVNQLLGFIRTAAIVQVISGTTNNAVAGSGFVDVQPLVNLMDGLGNNSGSHGIVHNLPFLRLQGGANAIINDPQVNDIGLVICCDRDISVVKNTKALSQPGSFRRNDLADGIYLFSILTGVPTQYIQFTSTGLNIADISSNLLALIAAGIEINGVTIPRGGSGTGQTGTFTSQDGKTITVTNGFITGIV